MIKHGNYLILEMKEEFLEYYDKDCQQWRHDYMKPPRTFPCAFIHQHSIEPLFCGAWRPVSIEEAKSGIKKSLTKQNTLCEKTLIHLNEISS